MTTAVKDKTDPKATAPKLQSVQPKKERPVYTGPDLNVGETCLFYRGGDLRSQPQAAICVETNGQGILKLAIIPVINSHVVVAMCVRHASDPYNRERPDMAIKLGCWDFVKPRRPLASPQVDEELVAAMVEAFVKKHLTLKKD